MTHALSHIDTWIFDLDNTLYPPEARLFDQIEVLMTAYVMRELGVDEAQANRLRTQYWRDYGTTLSGMMQLHDVDPNPYLVEVHDISLHTLTPDLALRAAIQALPGRKIVYTNGSRFHAERVTEARGLSGIFDDMFGIEHAAFHPKPTRQAFDTIIEKANITPKTAAMFEDDARNLESPKALGMATILVGPPEDHAFIDAQTEDLTAFLSQFVAVTANA